MDALWSNAKVDVKGIALQLLVEESWSSVKEERARPVLRKTHGDDDGAGRGGRLKPAQAFELVFGEHL